MRFRAAGLVLIPLIFCLPHLNAGDCQPVSPVLSIGEYQEQLNSINNRLKEARSDSDYDSISSCLPEKWTVQNGSAHFEVASWEIRDELHELRKETDQEERADDLESLESRLETMRDQAGLYDQRSFENERDRLNRILAQPEYRRAIGPGWRERFKDWLYGLLFRLLGASLEKIAGMGILLRIIGWSLVLLAFAFLMKVLFRWLSSDRTQPLAPGTIAISARHWTNWLAQARSCAARNDWRGAIHFAYWAGISYLENEGCWPADRARTPREYLLLLDEQGERRGLLVSLTRKFEYFWYGQHEAGRAEFEDTLRDLEALGCR